MIPLSPVKPQRKVLEKDVEAHLIKGMKALGGECYKWSSMNVRGVPDRICVFPWGEVWFVELKRDHTGRLSELQKRFFKRMRELNVKNASVLMGKEEVDKWLRIRRGFM